MSTPNIAGNGNNSDFGQALMQAGGVSGMRPFIGDDGKAYVSVYTPKPDGSGSPTDPTCYHSVQVNAATLRREEWQHLDTALLQVARMRLGAYSDLLSAGLVYPLANAFGTTVLETHTSGDPFEADLSMDGIARSKNDNDSFGHNFLPIPIAHVDYDINLRQLEASRRMGNALDTTNLENAARKVNEKIENLLFTGTVFSFGGGKIYSYLTQPDRNTHTIAVDWATASPEQILNDVIAMKQQLIDNNMFGPYKIYIPTAYETALDKDFVVGTKAAGLAAGNITVKERLMKVANISGISISDFLPAGNVVMVQLTSNVVRAVEGVGLSNVEWQSHGNFKKSYKVFRISVPQIRSDQKGQSGVCHASVS